MPFDCSLWWRGLSLAWRYTTASFGVLLIGMLLIGWWVSAEIQRGVVQNTATATALYMNSFVAPEVAELEFHGALSATAQENLMRLHRDTPLAERIVALKIWLKGGKIAYSSRAGVAGQTFPLTDELIEAWSGRVTADFSGLTDEEDAAERSYGKRLLEIYSPIRAKGSDRIIAVAEFYATVTELEEHMAHARNLSWLVVAGVTLFMFGALFIVVRGGSDTIARQEKELRARVEDLSVLLRQNAELHERVLGANNRALEINERFLRRVGAELHDGAAQALGFTLLRLDSIKQAIAGIDSPGNALTKANDDIDAIRSALDEALRDIRNLSSGLAMPELDNMNLRAILQRLVRAHERRSGTQVSTVFEGLPELLPSPMKIGIYRFIQEALNNASSHGHGVAQVVTVRTTGSSLEVVVSDRGPGFDPGQLREPGQLGLSGMRERVESLGGRFSVDSNLGSGTWVSAILPLPERSETDV